MPRPVYTSPAELNLRNPQNESPPMYPTFLFVTQNMDAKLNVIEKDFKVDKTYLHEDFYAPYNEQKKLWFFKNFPRQRKHI